MADRYRADQVGSLLRSPELLAARDAFAAGSLTLEQLREAEDRAILNALQMQEQTGVEVYTDGELRRRAWMTDLADAVEGFTAGHVAIEWHGPGGGLEESHAQVVGGPLRQVRRLTQHETVFLREHAPGPFKMTVPAPSSFMNVAFKAGLTDRFYPTRRDLVREMAGIVRGELVALAEEGVPYIQLDAPYYCTYMDDRLREELRADGVDPETAFADAVEADNLALEGVGRDGVAVGIHICRGNSRSRWLAEGGYDRIAERLFGSLNVDRFLLEYDTERSGGFEPLRFVPGEKMVVLGLVTTKEPAIESVDELRQRIDDAARFVDVDRLALSPQCGFASTALGNRLGFDEQRRKLELVAETSRLVWG
jgi:5-methyltetrahydropteroyltriglutamate--homocysteine methyltransferase